MTKEEKAASAAPSKKKAPDGGYGWVIVFGAALTHFLLVGMARSLGVLYLILLEKFAKSASATSWVIALFNTCRTLTAPICSVLLEKMGGRGLAITGSLVLCLGLVLSAFSRELWNLYFTFGALGGFGGAMVFVPAYVMVSKYFDKHKGKAMAFATIGSGLGNVAFAPVINVLFDYYGLAGALCLLGAFQLHNAIAGSLYRSLPDPPLPAVEMSVISDGEKATDGLIEKQEEKVYQATTVKKNEGPSFLQSLCGPGSIARNWTFYLYGFLVVSMQTCIMTFLIFLPDFCTELGVDRHTAALTLTIFGFCDMGGRFLFGFLFDLRRVRNKRRDFYCFVTFMFGLTVAAMSLIHAFVGVCILAGIVAIFEGASHSQRATIVSEIVQPHQMSRSVGIVIFCQGLGNMTGPPFAGYLKDITGTCRYGFVVCGVLLMSASAIFLAESFLCRTCRQKQWQQVSQQVQ